MTVNCNPQPALQVYGDSINHVSDFRYLGSMVASGSSDLKRRKSLAWCAFWKLEQLWKSPHISIATKVKLFNPRLTKLFFETRLTKGVVTTPSLDIPNRTPLKLILVSIGRYGPSLSIHTKMSTIGQGVT